MGYLSRVNRLHKDIRRANFLIGILACSVSILVAVNKPIFTPVKFEPVLLSPNPISEQKKSK